MTIQASLGRIGFTERGAWVDTTNNYRMNDLVHHNNGIWRCIIEGTRVEPSSITPDWTLWVQGSSNTIASGISFNPATTHLTATNMQAAAEQLARAATTTVQGLGRTATPQEIQDRAYAGNIPAYVTAADLPIIPTNRATETVFGNVRLATISEVSNRETVGNTPAVVTPELLPETSGKLETVRYEADRLADAPLMPAAWAYIDGVSTPPKIVEGKNITSVTKESANGLYTIRSSAITTTSGVLVKAQRVTDGGSYRAGVDRGLVNGAVKIQGMSGTTGANIDFTIVIFNQ